MQINTAKTLLHLEFAEDPLQMSCAGLLEAPGSSRVCVSPAPAVELERLGLDYLSPHVFVSSASIQSELSNNWNKLATLTSIIDRYIPYGETACYYLRVLLDTCSEKIIHVDSILQELQPRCIVFCLPAPLSFDFRLLFDETESIYAQILPLVVKAKMPSCHYLALQRQRGPAAKKVIVSSVRRLLKLFSSMQKRCISWSKYSAGGSILFVEEDHGLNDAASILAARHRVIRWLPSEDSIFRARHPWMSLLRTFGIPSQESKYLRMCHSAWEAFAKDKSAIDLFECRGVNYFAIVAERLKHLFTNVFPQLHPIEQAAHEMLLRYDIKCIVSTYFSRPHTYVIARAARSARIPVVTMQHSSYGYWDWPLAKYTDGIMSDHKMVGGEEVANYVRLAEGSGTKPIPTGLVPLDNMIEEARRTVLKTKYRPSVVYPLASYVKNYIHYTSTRMTLTEYFEINRSIIRVLSRFPHIDVIVRLHPAGMFRDNTIPLEQWVRHNNWKHIRFEWGGNAIESMRKADLIVIDSPSTVLLHAITTDRKVLVYNRSFPMTEAGLAALRKRVIYEDDLGAFLSLLERTIQDRDFDNTSHANDDFLRLYGTYRGDGQSLSRVVTAIEQVAMAEGNGVPRHA